MTHEQFKEAADYWKNKKDYEGIGVMKIIISPAKKMITDTDSIAPVGMPDHYESGIKGIFEMHRKISVA